MKVINDKIDFDIASNHVIRQSEVWLPSFKLKAGHFTDTGYRF